jgi:uncharacterized GH25 family protein
MRKTLTASLLALAAVSAASAHFVWIVPDTSDKGRALVVFSDTLDPDKNPALLDRIAQTRLFVQSADGKDAPVEWKKQETSYTLSLPAANACVGGICKYGVTQRGDSKPFLLVYYPKLIVGQPGGKAWDRLDLEMVPTRTGKGLHIQVLHHGKPAPADLEVTLSGPKDQKGVHKTNARGELDVETPEAGVYGLRVAHTVNEAGEHEGKKYEQVRTYATLVLTVARP